MYSYFHSIPTKRMKFRCRTALYGTVISETLDKVSVLTTFAQSRLGSVSTSLNISSLKKSRSPHLLFFESRRFTVNILYGISVISCLYLIKSCINQELMTNLHCMPLFGLGLSLDLETNIPGLGLITETRRFKVTVSVSTLRLQDS